ncbi:hypothetical protein EDC04DRAFT_1580986 [Pisolithus marmoratus]|nr:hypothetical protein EDC04DRAFT_1580986 [Pisolithus marmoratus]
MEAYYEEKQMRSAVKGLAILYTVLHTLQSHRLHAHVGDKAPRRQIPQVHSRALRRPTRIGAVLGSLWEYCSSVIVWMVVQLGMRTSRNRTQGQMLTRIERELRVAVVVWTRGKNRGRDLWRVFSTAHHGTVLPSLSLANQVHIATLIRSPLPRGPSSCPPLNTQVALPSFSS